ncbi:hypothetical protein [Pseudolysinimonas sp.]
MVSTNERLAEAVAGWRLQLPEAHRYLIEAAVAAVVDECESEAVAELAGSELDNPFLIDAAIERAIPEAGLGPLLHGDLGVVATRRFARDVRDGRLNERELTRWVHARFGHEAEADILNRLSELDDEFDIADGEREVSRVRADVREAAEQLLREGVH